MRMLAGAASKVQAIAHRSERTRSATDPLSGRSSTLLCCEIFLEWPASLHVFCGLPCVVIIRKAFPLDKVAEGRALALLAEDGLDVKHVLVLCNL